MSEDGVLSPLGYLTNKDIQQIQQRLPIPLNQKTSDVMLGWCSVAANKMTLDYFDNNVKLASPPACKLSVMLPVAPDDNEISVALHSLLKEFAFNRKTHNIDLTDLIGTHGERIGVVFMVHRNIDNIRPSLIQMAHEIHSQLIQKMLQNELNTLKKSYKDQLKIKEREIKQLDQKLIQLRNENSKLEKQMLFQQSHDIATKMLNRSGLENALSVSLNSNTIVEGDAYISVILIQITNGERIQARIGCDGFDQLLRQFEQQVNLCTSSIHHIARISTTELALATTVPSLDEKFLPDLCHQLSHVARQGFMHNGQEVHLHVFMGVANSYHTNNSSQLINYAFQAAIACKESGSLVNTFTQADQQEQKEFNQLEHYLLQAVRNDDLILHFQPKVDLKTNRWVGAEVLLRWKHPILGDISNEALIHMAEQNGLIVEVGYFVLRNAIDRASEWIEIAPEFCLSVNVSAKQICSPDFATKVSNLLKQNELPASNLEFELTESCLVSNFDTAKRNIETLKKQGVKFALDDFGTGYASFNYLKKLPFDAIKIDKEFLANILHSSQDRAIFRSIVNIANKLDKQIVVEGVETSEQHAFVADERCDIGQGYFYARPMSRDIFESQLSKQYPAPKQFIIR
ncbi:putative bifunctional diguanylate cyclase/phosphodiesterase [Vibrio hangzhouensis]|uniref:EAL domain, c-di-GMP-specific phosphodiesterase class I (Or its enzymatically inactive variant) n=1 Tax=Vibrio hangzhouensis TaxID=462991 RepID=A0A1H5WWH1_9VIBR|nr:bifunctional diguanylate cyclase/phosphodiesterase [Vibrio hangzhouensis]SEG03446.1 EAL domain, c-di-GMP-specific phosphodiesterase class I (or its enzymatically inactive variant) [Vibrio hangzhouensis]